MKYYFLAVLIFALPVSVFAQCYTECRLIQEEDDCVFVNPGYIGEEHGTKTQPFNTLQEAVNFAVQQDVSCLLIKEGVVDNQGVNFEITNLNQFSIYGGFADSNFDWNTRDPSVYQTRICGVQQQGVTTTVNISTNSWLLLDGLWIETYSNHTRAIDIKNSDHVKIQNCFFPSQEGNTDNQDQIIAATAQMAPCSSMVIRNNYFWATGPRAIHLDGVSGTWLVEGNYIMNCNDVAIVVEDTASSGNIKSNTVDNCSNGIEVEGNYPVNILRNCVKSISGMNVGILLDSDSSQDTICFNNICHAIGSAIKAQSPSIIKSNGISQSLIGILDEHLSGQVQILNNSIKNGNGSNNVGIFRNTSSALTIAYNNIMSETYIGLNTSSLINFSYDYNCFHANTHPRSGGCFEKPHDIEDNPQFIDQYWPIPSWKFFLETTSPCINNGNDDPPYGTTQIDHSADTGVIDVGAHLPDVCIPGPN